MFLFGGAFPLNNHAIEARELVYTYEDGTVALDHISFSAQTGKITGILGSNGAGKSTLFLNLNGVLTPKSGQVLIDGEPVTYNKKGIQLLRKNVGIVFQDPDNQLFSADVYRDISFGAINLGLDDAEVRRRVDWAMEKTGITALKDKPTHALSFGQKKRVAIAGILVMEPKIMILDEPTAGLDPQGVSDIMHLLTTIRDHLNMTIIIATHDMDIVPLYCDDAYLLSGGKMKAYGTPEQLFSNPELLRENHLRLPRIAHLMEILNKKDGLETEMLVSTISGARTEIKRMIQEKGYEKR